jgi:purine nucleoside phosphorylase
MAELDKKWLDGLMMTGATQKKVKDQNTGRETVKSTPYERQAKPADVMSFGEYGDTVVIVLRNGMKHKVSESGKAPAPAKDAG